MTEKKNLGESHHSRMKQNPISTVYLLSDAHTAVAAAAAAARGTLEA